MYAPDIPISPKSLHTHLLISWGLATLISMIRVGRSQYEDNLGTIP